MGFGSQFGERGARGARVRPPLRWLEDELCPDEIKRDHDRRPDASGTGDVGGKGIAGPAGRCCNRKAAGLCGA